MAIRKINIDTIAEVANGFKDLNSEIVFVGGAVISLYITDQAADELRTTNDIDMTVKLSTYSDWIRLQNQLLNLGFYPNLEGHSNSTPFLF